MKLLFFCCLFSIFAGSSSYTLNYSKNFSTNIEEKIEIKYLNEEVAVPSNFTEIYSEVEENYSTKFHPKTLPGFRCPKPCHCAVSTVAHCTRSFLRILPCDIKANVEGKIKYRNTFSIDIVSLYASHNRIKIIPANCFASSGRNMRTLFLKSNAIETVNTDAFRGLKQIKTIDLSENRLTVLTCYNCSVQANRSASIFAKVSSSLTTLFLSYNKIETIPTKSFVGFWRLETLFLDHNHIRWISLRAFQDLNSLKILQIRGNPLTPIAQSRISLNLAWFSSRFYFVSSSTGAFVANPSMPSTCNSEITERTSQPSEVIEKSVSWVTESNVSLTAFAQFTTSYTSATAKETLISLDLGKLRLTEVPLGLTKTLSTLHLDGNFISYVSVTSFSELVNLEQLVLSKNQLQNISAAMFGNLGKLQMLDLSSNKISYLSSNSFCGLQSLFTLKLNNNPNLSVLPEKIFDPTPFLGYLYLQDCNIQTLPGGMWIFGLIGLWLYRNPLICECDSVAPIVIKLKFGNPSPFRKNLYLDDYRKKFFDEYAWSGLQPVESTCNLPTNITGVLVGDLSLEDLSCSEKELATVMANRLLTNPFIFNNRFDEFETESSTTTYEDYSDVWGEIWKSEIENHLGSETHLSLNSSSSDEETFLHSFMSAFTSSENSSITTNDFWNYNEYDPRGSSGDSSHIGNNTLLFPKQTGEGSAEFFYRDSRQNNRFFSRNNTKLRRKVTRSVNTVNPVTLLNTNDAKTNSVDVHQQESKNIAKAVVLQPSNVISEDSLSEYSSQDQTYWDTYDENYFENLDSSVVFSESSTTSLYGKNDESASNEQISFEHYLTLLFNVTQLKRLKKLVKEISSQQLQDNFVNKPLAKFSVSKYYIHIFNITESQLQ